MNIDACRFGYGDPCWVGPQEKHKGYPNGIRGNTWSIGKPPDLTRTDPFFFSEKGRWPANIYQCSKASRGEREEGLEDHESKDVVGKNGNKYMGVDSAGSRSSEVKNFHPTVKPVKLMSWLVRLVTPIDGVVVYTFCGSGTTLVASELEGKYNGIGIEMNPEYCDIIYGRVKHANKKEE